MLLCVVCNRLEIILNNMVAPFFDSSEPASGREESHGIPCEGQSSDPIERPDFYKKMLDVSVDCIKLLNLDGTVRYINRSGCIALGVPVGETVFGMDWLSLMPASVRHNGKRAMSRARKGQKAQFSGLRILRGQKTMFMENILTPVLDSNGKATAILCVSRDITMQREAEMRLRSASENDPLTGLFNRRAFRSRLHRMLNQSRIEERKVGLFLVDLDHFKHVNDTLGYAAGDYLLRVLSRRLTAILPPDGFVARLGGDEFAIVCPIANGDADMGAFADLILQQTDKPITYSNRPINGGMSIGCGLYPRDAQDVSGLLRCADTALNDLKARGRGGYRLFGQRMMDLAAAAATQLATARHMLRDNLIVPHYQPKVELVSNRIVGFEALLRWDDGANGMQSPATICGAFRNYELASAIGDVMQRHVFADMVRWRDAGMALMPVSINAAPVEFLHDRFAENFLKRLKDHNIPPALVELEITEHMLSERGSELVVRAAEELSAAGIRVLLDDFGTGRSSLAHLRDYPVDGLKIDYSFTRDIVTDPSILAIVRAIAQLGPSLSLDVIAEGIETEEQRSALIALGCGYGQGFLFSKAVCANEVAGMLETVA